ncbi:saccharopine dehydrogenase NADP-binding domain-containing protein [Pseudomonas matsuisoli]|uniref:Saccharopine dehydrogenase NADP binding domain-containing protein n=1 Tax=Pseudomonas matsuisoli TaxID=1515666 RepID=A0A917PPF5_9PSED|nr:saccharopine dehydrogenase NADP-binding domain-containing protein [Pseudomonas matsuisoli]GGJ87002.1 hypothetical protein GCM10009304_11210 [Pseudomonas matsuisoli]
MNRPAEFQPRSTSVLVIGGSGETGQRILGALQARHPDWTLTCASRHAGRALDLPPTIRRVALDAQDTSALVSHLEHHDLVVLAAGPIDVLGASVHQACLQAGVDCVDINDSLEAADAIFALQGEAVARQCRLLTGMGLTPGLSGLLLMKLVREGASTLGVYRSRFYAGAAYGGGAASPYVILDSFAREKTLLVDGVRQQGEVPPGSFHFPGQTKSLPLFAHAAPEIAGLAGASNRSETGAIRTLDYRYHIQFLSPGMANLFGRLARWPGMRERLAKMFHKSGQSMKRRKAADRDCSLWVYPDDRPEAGWVLHGEISSYDFTALSACAAVELLLERHVQVAPGVHGMEQLPAPAHEAIEASLRRYGITARRADDLARPDEPLPFGWCSVVTGEAASLRHFGCCWYDCEPHPRMVALQKTYLTDSVIWARLRAALPGVRFAGFVARFLRRWRQHHRALASYRRRYPDQAASWSRITRDVSMFTSGYSLARDVLGQAEAFALYRQMFLDTGRMEMRWLWPAPEVMAATNDPVRSTHQYWSAFVARYQALGLLTAEISDDGVEIRQCTFADMFTLLGCPELSLLMREMEEEALRHLGSQTGAVIDWHTGEAGRAEVRITATQSPVLERSPAADAAHTL